MSALALGLTAVAVARQGVPPSVAASAPKTEVTTEQEKAAQCVELKGALEYLKRDPAWGRDRYAAAEVLQMQRVLDSIGCPTGGGALVGTWTFEGGADKTPNPVSGTVTFKSMTPEAGRKKAEENWAQFTLKQTCIGVDVFYLGTITWAPGSYYLKEGGWPFFEGKLETAMMLVCGTEGIGTAQVSGRFRAEPHLYVGGAVEFYAGPTSIEGDLHPMPGPPYSLHFTGTKAK